ncbi:MAG: dTDP-4-amino-4,6-dideoxygalactose transaminase [Clostridiaceae bacterium]
MKIPFNKAHIAGNEIEYIKDAIDKSQLCGDGSYTAAVADRLCRDMEFKNIKLTTSGTHALEMAVLIAELKPGDEVIMPSFTFSSTANAVLLRGARPVFADVEFETLNIDCDDVEKKLTKRTKAIIPVHYGGIGCDMDRIMDIAANNGLIVIEDAAQALYSKYKGRFLGGIGHFGCFSFHSTKNYISGEGGAIVINSSNNELLQRAEIIRQKGTNRESFLNGEVDKYSWVGAGSSYSPSDILMAFLFGQLQHRKLIIEKRQAVHNSYSEGLRDLAGHGAIKGMTKIPACCESNYHIFYLILENSNVRSRFVNELKKREISAYTHYTPLHSSKMGLSISLVPEELPVTDKVSEGLIRLPLYTDMTVEEVDYVISSIHSIMKVI